MTAYLNQVQKYVVSSTLTDPQWENTVVLGGDPVEEYRLFGCLFPDGYRVERLSLAETRSFRSGIGYPRRVV